MKKAISVLLCLSMLMSLTGCAGVSQEDLEEIKDTVVSELESYIQEAGSQLAQQLKARFQEVLNQGKERIESLFPKQKEAPELSCDTYEPERLKAKGPLSWLSGKREKGSLQAFIAQQYGSDASWDAMDEQARRECVREYFGDTVYTVSKSELQQEVEAFLKAESDASGVSGDYRLDKLAAKYPEKEKQLQAVEVVREEAELLNTVITPQLCGACELLGDDYVPSLGILLTTASFLEDSATLYRADPKQLDPEEVLDLLVRMTSSAINCQTGLMWVYDIPLKVAMQSSKELIKDFRNYRLELAFIYALPNVNLTTKVNMNRWGVLGDAERVKNGEGPTAAETAQLLAELFSLRESSKVITDEMLRDMSKYLRWRMVYEMTALLEEEGYTVDESVSLLCALCDRVKGLW